MELFCPRFDQSVFSGWNRSETCRFRQDVVHRREKLKLGGIKAEDSACDAQRERSECLKLMSTKNGLEFLRAIVRRTTTRCCEGFSSKTISRRFGRISES